MNISIGEANNPPLKSNPWAKIESPIFQCSFEEVMSEQLAEDLNLKENGQQLDQPESLMQTATASSLVGEKETNGDSDFLLAQLLQHEFDKEYDEMLKSNEKVRNRESRVQISLDKFKLVHPFNDKHETEINLTNRGELPSESESEDGISFIKII